jgi:glycosyltransferase involved in cell wall biosynthesis
MTNTKPTVCQILHALRVGGAEVLAARLARQLREQYRFLFVCLDDLGTLGEELAKEGFAVHVLGRRPGLDWRCMLRLAGLLRREGVQLLHAHQYTPFFYAATARWLSGRVPVLFTEHGRHFPDYPRRKRMLANRLLLNRHDRIVGVGQAVRQALIDNEGIAAERAQVIYNGIDLSPYRNGVPSRELTRKNMGVEPGDFVIMQVARLDYLKDHATALRTLGRVVKQLPRARLVLVGEGPELEKIQEHIHQSELAAHVRLLGLRKDVAQLLPAADLFLLTSISEGIPLTVIEAMAARLPVVATRVGGLGEIITEEATGLLAPSGDDEALAKHILRLAEDPSQRAHMGQLGRERALAKFSEPQMHAGYQKLYEEMLCG